jgi:hypothetical protein
LLWDDNLDPGAERCGHGCNGPELRVRLGGEEPPDTRRVFADLPGEVGLCQAEVLPTLVEGPHDVIDLPDLCSSLLVFVPKAGVGTMFGPTPTVKAGVQQSVRFRFH